MIAVMTYPKMILKIFEGPIDSGHGVLVLLEFREGKMVTQGQLCLKKHQIQLLIRVASKKHSPKAVPVEYNSQQYIWSAYHVSILRAFERIYQVLGLSPPTTTKTLAHCVYR